MILNPDFNKFDFNKLKSNLSSISIIYKTSFNWSK